MCKITAINIYYLLINNEIKFCKNSISEFDTISICKEFRHERFRHSFVILVYH